MLTAADAEVRQRRVAVALAERGLGTGDRLGVVAPSSADLLVLVLGALRRAIVPVLVNPSLLPGEQDGLLADADCALVLRGDEVAGLASDGDDRQGVELAPVPLARPMHYTSGTGGTPKAVWSAVNPHNARSSSTSAMASASPSTPDHTPLGVPPVPDV